MTVISHGSLLATLALHQQLGGHQILVAAHCALHRACMHFYAAAQTMMHSIGSTTSATAALWTARAQGRAVSGPWL